ncbi:MAG: transcription termination/antitermination protein NusG [Lachnospiraceae bacterium]|nr:transcription termination/antitermination protein NusG [Lachnospiraceae bacterium]
MSDINENCTSNPAWYVAHTYSGYENKVKANLEKIIENRGLQDVIMDVRIPVEVETTETVGEDGIPVVKEVESKIFPSYILVKMIMTDATWHIVRNIRGVTGFVGPGSKPVPLTDEEVAHIGVEVHVIELDYEVGDSVTIVDGPLKDYVGTVESISDDKKKIKVLVSMFGRETPVELDSGSAKRIEY